MPKDIAVANLAGAFDTYLVETFEKTQGIYLDRTGGTSLFETLETISAEQASQPISDECACIAAHVEHMRLFLEVMEDALLDRDPGDVDWSEIWRKVKKVSPRRWERNKTKLKETYDRIRGHLQNHEKWDGERELSCILPMIAHSAYHLGEIRQAMCRLREMPASED